MRQESSGQAPTALETISCPLCGASQHRVITRAPDYLRHQPGVYQVVRCVNCGHHYTNPRPTVNDIARYYTSSYQPHQPKAAESAAASTVAEDTTIRLSSPPWYLKRPVRAIPGLRRFYYWLRADDVYMFPPLTKASAHTLELGCAHGVFLERLRERGWHAQGVELISAAAAQARQRGFAVHTGTLESAEFPAENFDAVFAWMVLEHLHDPLATLGEMRRILPPGGYLAISVPNAGCWERWAFGRYWYAWDLPIHLQHFSARGIKELLERSGFEVLEMRSQAHLLTLIGSLGIWLRTMSVTRKFGDWLVHYCDCPRMWGQVLLALPAKLLAKMGQTGYLTILARQQRDFQPIA